MPPERSLQETRTVKGGQVAAAGTIGAGAIGAIQETVGQAHEALTGVMPYLDAAKWGLLAVPLIGIGVMLWAHCSLELVTLYLDAGSGQACGRFGG
jgi:hypothetical protein